MKETFGRAIIVTKEYGWLNGSIPTEVIDKSLNDYPLGIKNHQEFPIVFNTPLPQDKPIAVIDIFVPVKAVPRNNNS